MVKMTAFALIILLVFFAIYLMIGRVPLKLSSPIDAVETFHQALIRREWHIASKCLSDEIRKNNESFLDQESLFTLSFWQDSRGLESVVNDRAPLLEKDLSFHIKDQTQSVATVAIDYPRYREKTVRLHEIGLKIDSEGKWKVSEVFGATTGKRKSTQRD